MRIDEFPDEEPHIEDRVTKVKDYEERSLTTVERDEIIRKYNIEHSSYLKDTEELAERIDQCEIPTDRSLEERDKIPTKIRTTDRLYEAGSLGPNIRTLNRAYQDQYYYFFDRETPHQYVNNAVQHLKHEGNTPTTNSDIKSILNSQTSVEHLRSGRTRVHGSVMNLLCDILNLSLKEFEGHIEKITGKNGRGGIYNPNFLEGTELETTIAGVLGVVVSDCHVRLKGGTTYFESNLKRIDEFKMLLSRFGEIRWGITTPKMRNGSRELWIPIVIDNMIRLVGIPAGDRTILNYGLPIISKTWSIAATCEYMKQMFAQESTVKPNGKLVWGRWNAIHAGTKSDRYSFESRISESALEFLKTSEELVKLRRNQTLQRIRERYITIARLKELKENGVERDARIAEELLKVVEENRNHLIDDEVMMLKKLGIQVSLGPRKISFYENTERVTIGWSAEIASNTSRTIVALILSPPHPKKRKRLNKWLQTRPSNSVNEVREILRKKGIMF